MTAHVQHMKEQQSTSLQSNTLVSPLIPLIPLCFTDHTARSGPEAEGSSFQT